MEAPLRDRSRVIVVARIFDIPDVSLFDRQHNGNPGCSHFLLRNGNLTRRLVTSCSNCG